MTTITFYKTINSCVHSFIITSIVINRFEYIHLSAIYARLTHVAKSKHMQAAFSSNFTFSNVSLVNDIKQFELTISNRARKYISRTIGASLNEILNKHMCEGNLTRFFFLERYIFCQLRDALACT